MADPIALAVPVFFVLVAVELLVARRRVLAIYRVGDALGGMLEARPWARALEAPRLVPLVAACATWVWMPHA